MLRLNLMFGRNQVRCRNRIVQEKSKVGRGIIQYLINCRLGESTKRFIF